MVPHNLIHKCKHALINKGFKVFITLKTHTHTHKHRKTHELKQIEIENWTKKT